MPESNEHDLLNITRVINQPLTLYLYVLTPSSLYFTTKSIPWSSGQCSLTLLCTHRNDEVDVLIWGNVTLPNLSAASKVTYTINATANNGDHGSLHGHLHLCDALERMQ